MSCPSPVADQLRGVYGAAWLQQNLRNIPQTEMCASIHNIHIYIYICTYLSKNLSISTICLSVYLSTY